MGETKNTILMNKDERRATVDLHLNDRCMVKHLILRSERVETTQLSSFSICIILRLGPRNQPCELL